MSEAAVVCIFSAVCGFILGALFGLLAGFATIEKMEKKKR